jgi:hypothetical protein
MPVDLDDLQRALRETAHLSEEQISQTLGILADGAVGILNAWQDRRKTAEVDVVRKDNDNMPSTAVDRDAWEDSSPNVAPASKLDKNAPIQVSRKPQSIPFEEDLAQNQERRSDTLESPFTDQPVKKSTLEEQVFPDYSQPDRKSEVELLYDFNNKDGSSFQENIKAEDAQAIMDLIAGAEGSKIANGENLLITSKGKKLFETDANGVVTFSIANRDKDFVRRGNPISNSIQDLTEKAGAIVKNAARLNDELTVSKGVDENSPTQNLAADAPVESTETLNGYLNFANGADPVSQTPDLSPDEIAALKQNRQDKTNSLAYLKDNLPEGQTQDISDEYSLRADRRSDGIVELKMFEVDNPEPVVIARADDQGNVTQTKEYTAPRYAAVKAFVKNDELAREAPGKAPIPATTEVVDDVPEYNYQSSDIPDEVPEFNRRSAVAGIASTAIAITREKLVNLKNFYKNSPVGKALPESTGAEKRFNQQKAALLQLGKASTGNDKLAMKDDFFQHYQVASEDVNLSTEEQANIQPAEEFAAAQVQEKTQKQAAQRTSNKNVTR